MTSHSPLAPTKHSSPLLHWTHKDTEKRKYLILLLILGQRNATTDTEVIQYAWCFSDVTIVWKDKHVTFVCDYICSGYCWNVLQGPSRQCQQFCIHCIPCKSVPFNSALNMFCDNADREKNTSFFLSSRASQTMAFGFTHLYRSTHTDHTHSLIRIYLSLSWVIQTKSY